MQNRAPKVEGSVGSTNNAIHVIEVQERKLESMKSALTLGDRVSQGLAAPVDTLSIIIFVRTSQELGP